MRAAPGSGREAPPPQPQPPGWRVTPAPDGRGKQPAKPPSGPNIRWLAVIAVIALIALNFWVSSEALSPSPRVRIPYSPMFLAQVYDNNVASISSTNSAIDGTFKNAVKYPEGGTSYVYFSTQIPAFAPGNELFTELKAKGVVINAEPDDTGPSFLTSLIFGFGPTLLFVLLLVWLFRRAAAAGGGGAGGLMSFGRSRARRVEAADQRVTFNDVAGIDEAKAELTEIVDFLKNPDKYLKLGGRIPRGVLLSGAPGTGKTLLARAVAGEAGVPFFQMSASEFVEMIVGVGASRVRDLFAQAKEAAPAIIFIDELDAIGRSRSSGGPNISGGHDEREQTLNQILTEMDGFDPRLGVIVLGATNRPEILDPALLRPGRFDRRVVVSSPDRTGREAILRVHTRGVPLADDINLGAAGLHHAGHGRRRPREPRQRGGAARRPPQPREGQPRGPHRRARADRARRRAQGDDLRGGPPAHRLPRGRPRDRRDAHRRRRPGAQGLDHPPRPGARGHVLGARRRPVQLRAAAPARPDQGRARRTRRRGARVQRHHHRRRVRHPASDPDRAGHGRAVGHEPRDRPDRGAPGGRDGAVPARASQRPRSRPSGSSTRRSGGSSSRPTPRSATLLREHRSNLDSLVAALLEHETLDEVDAYAAAGLPRNPLAEPEPHVTLDALHADGTPERPLR